MNVFNLTARGLIPACVAVCLPALLLNGADEGAGGSMSYTEKRLLEVVQKQEELFKRYEGKEELDTFDLEDLEMRARTLSHQYESIIADSPDEVMAYILYGKMLRRIGQNERAVEMFLDANKIDPGIAVVKQQLGNYMAENGKYAEALGFFMQAVYLSPDTALYHYQMGEILATFKEDFLAEGLFTAAELDTEMQKAFAEAVHFAPDNRDFKFRYAESFYDATNPDWEKALVAWTELEESAESALDKDAARLHRANVLYSMGRFEESRRLANTVATPALGYSRDQLLEKLDSALTVKVTEEPDVPSTK